MPWALAERAVEAGDLDREIDPLDLLRALAGVLNIASGPQAGARTHRLLDVLLSGAGPAPRPPD